MPFVRLRVQGTLHRPAAGAELRAHRPRARLPENFAGTVLATIIAISGLSALPAPAAEAAGERPKAVIIVGPTGSLTSSNLADGEAMARSAEAQGMDVRRIFHPRATWERVLANIQGANLVVYMGHGNGWPSPYGPFQEKTKNGFGLNPYEGGSAGNHTYYGAKPIREKITLAPNAVVLLVHLCYASGNAEPGMAIPSEDIARQRVDNFAAGFLAAGARAVFSFGWNQKLDFVKALNTTDKTMDELFMTPAAGKINGFVGWRNKRFESVRTPGAVNHLDPHRSEGYYRAVTGDLAMTAGEWRDGTAPSGVTEPPAITSIEIADSPGTASVAGEGSTSGAFHPNGDGLADQLLVRHTVSRSAYLDVTVTDAGGATVDSYTHWSDAGPGSSTWDGRRAGGGYVPDGRYTLTYVPRDRYGNVGQAVAVEALVLTAIAVAEPSAAAFFSRDGDTLAPRSTFNVRLNQPADVAWTVLDAAGRLVRTVRSPAAADAGLLSFSWDGRDDAGAFVPDGIYRSVVSAGTSLGEYSHERTVFVGAFRLGSSTATPARGSRVKFVVRSTERLEARPWLEITQPGLAPYTVRLEHVRGRKYRVTVTLKSGGAAGEMTLVVRGRDENGQSQETLHRLPLR